MALAGNVLQAVVSGARAILDGIALTLSSFKFWRTHGITTTADKRDVIKRATAIASGSVQAELSGFQGSMESIYQGTGYGTLGGQGGPAETPNATVYVQYSYDKGGDTKFAAHSFDVKWSDDLSDILAAIEHEAGDLEAKYGVSNVTMLPGSLIIF